MKTMRFVPLLLVIAGCSTSVEPEPPSHPADPTPAPVLAPTELAFRPGDVTKLYTRVMPNGVCTVRGENGPVPQALPMLADEQGVLHFDVTPTQEGLLHAWLDCHADGSPVSYPLDIAGSYDTNRLAESEAAMEATRQATAKPNRLPLVGHPLSYDRGTLLQQGYGWRPDPETEPVQFARWLDGTTKPARTITRSVGSGIYNGNWQVGTDGNWAGGLARTPGTLQTCLPGLGFAPRCFTTLLHFAYSYTEFTVPQVFAPASFVELTTAAATWAGLGGESNAGVANDDILWQAGAIEGTVTIGFVQTATYHAFWELVPQNDAQMLGMSVNNGDYLSAHVWVCDTANNLAKCDSTSSTAALCVNVHDWTGTQQDYTPGPLPIAAAAGGSIFGDAYDYHGKFASAENVQERPFKDGGYMKFAQFNPFGIGSGVCNSINQCKFYGTDLFSYLFVNMSRDATHATPANQLGGGCFGKFGTTTCVSSDPSNIVVWWDGQE
jgi:hypothetical protein